MIVRVYNSNADVMPLQNYLSVETSISTSNDSRSSYLAAPCLGPTLAPFTLAPAIFHRSGALCSLITNTS
jgi:hypothetical protein